ncbi:class I SAM-dependent methyltransferase [Thioalkalivibrio sulfidiphilus]|uniref:class I SAM-dependent methyltransferase n=1 Tax=Thioalkalivibrio sulfidiphilus TaxID=1033854 RepID=UPI003B31F5D4
MSDTRISIRYASEDLRERAEALAAELNLPLAGESAGTPLVLILDGHGLSLALTAPDAPGPIQVDFVTGRLGYRQARISLRSEPLARAVGIKGSERPSVVDATAGLGRDGFVLASLGCEVTLLEREPVIAALLADGLERAARDADLAQTIARMHLVTGNARGWLTALDEAPRPDVIYLDPMYPHRDKSALVKKEMRVFRTLVGDDQDAPETLEAALAVAKRRVVVKRPARAEPLSGRKPSHQIPGKTTRFDVYVTG